MDPEAAYQKAMDALARIRAAESEGWSSSAEAEKEAAADDLAEGFEALDEWLTKGGYLPRAWGTLQERWDRANREDDN